MEKGGRDTKNETIIQINPYDFYVGLEKPNLDYGYVKTGDEIKIKALLVNRNGKPVAGKTLKYKIYKNRFNCDANKKENAL